ncbi:peptide deformylase [Candidatus Gracilibacteria bacterium]|nr:peptide deformylase [Candidatus Gracilibacteria bacterium]OIO75736.1 MAG: peptide deformylase [Candidatus Gracilibacteria bacterium CG1_02_38_174]PIQ12373.1 MAG: peptide deformylase [Candidatus Gracilibacteria bacterium CG18_big_fil_WC_8_21_14_2_50_38_16]PIQ41281.1 MAG: peptide deformylase [Candidatus Gracilibacteria bacterium CG12_big_fil_rev_8_21_14_0_65_38_15]PIZ01378.1 MAG: peptide deformylase [Candidatus Gracilibacteria bacterium CG_4_10_14_0_8_um_filter_38_28]
MHFDIQTGKTNEILRTKSEKVTSAEMRKYIRLGEDMVGYIKNPDNGGVGLAAPQIGINKRVIAVSLIHDRDEKEDENYRTIAMINPEITDHTEEMEYDNEGCLSIPGEHGDVDRWKRIKVSYIDSSLRPQSILLSGFAARIVQHEVDHLDGVLFTDRVKKIEKASAKN